MKKDYAITYDTIFSKSPKETFLWLHDNYMCEIPTHLETTDDLQNASILLGKLTNIYSYVVSLSSYAKVLVKEMKHNGISKEELEVYMSIRDIYDTFAQTIKQQYSAISRMITVKKQIDDEMKMM